MAVQISSLQKENSNETSMPYSKQKVFYALPFLVAIILLCKQFASLAKITLAAATREEIYATNPTMEVKAIQNKTKGTENVSRRSQELQELQEWRRKRVEKDIYDNFWVRNSRGGLDFVPNADRNGPILDFAIAGFPKCGTTAMMRTLAAVTTMPSNVDVCKPVQNTIHYSYTVWADEFGNGSYNFTENKPLKGSKCPYWLEGSLRDLGKMLPKTNLIVGIRHPVMFFQSFTNQLLSKRRTKNLEEMINQNLLKHGQDNQLCWSRNARDTPDKVCVARSRFHLSLARLGKTLLGPKERQLLTAELYQSKRRKNDNSTELVNFPIPENPNPNSFGIPNNVFLFESGQGKEEYFYHELARFVRIDRDRLPPLDDKTYVTRWSGSNNQTSFIFDICLPQYEYIRKELLPISYTLGRWLLDFFIPASYQRDDVTIPNATNFAGIVKGYLRDPCNNTLVRNEADGEYYHYSSEVLA